MGRDTPKNDKSAEHLKYGEGQREQYGEGQAYRPEDAVEGTQETDEGGWAGGDHNERVPSSTGKNAEKGKPQR